MRRFTHLLLGLLFASSAAAQALPPGYYTIRGSSAKYLSGAARAVGLSTTAGDAEVWQFSGSFLQSVAGMTLLISSRTLQLQPQVNAAEAQVTITPLPDGKYTIARMATIDAGYFLADNGTTLGVPLGDTATLEANFKWTFTPVTSGAGRKPLQQAVALTVGTESIGWFGLQPPGLNKFATAGSILPAGYSPAILSGTTPAFTLTAAQRLANVLAVNPVPSNNAKAYPVMYLNPVYIKTVSSSLSVDTAGTSATFGGGAKQWFFLDPDGVLGVYDRVAYNATVIVRATGYGPYLTWDSLKDPILASPSSTTAAQRWLVIGTPGP
jgi:hypothetical protein